MKEKRKTPGVRIKTKLTVIIAAFTSVLLLTIWLLFVVFLDDFYEQIKYKEILNSAETIEMQIKEADYEELNGCIEEIHVDTGASVLVVRYIDTSREEVNFVGPRGVLSNNLTIRWIIEKARESGGETVFNYDNMLSGTQQSKKYDYENMLYAKVVDGEGLRYAIFINVQLTPVNATKTTIINMLIAVSVFFVAGALFVGYLVSSKLSDPLTKLNESARKIGTPEYRKMTVKPGCLETAELNETLAKASEEIKIAENQRRELIANVSHDLRTPLAMISGYGEMMRDIPGETTPQNIQIIIDEAERLNLLVADLLTISKLQNGLVTPDIRAFNITEMLREMINRYAAMRITEGFVITLQADKDYEIEGDELRITQVFYNLINNAINYTGDSKSVTVKQSEAEYGEEHCLRFDVIDDGDGILPENLPYIWDRYYKENRAHKRAEVGTGLGLSIVKQIMEMHGGKYGVISEPGKGSDFYVEFKLSKDSARNGRTEERSV